jgi:hypothetical protein
VNQTSPTGHPERRRVEPDIDEFFVRDASCGWDFDISMGSVAGVVNPSPVQEGMSLPINRRTAPAKRELAKEISPW